MTGRGIVLATSLLGLTAAFVAVARAAGTDVVSALQLCRKIEDPEARLACFDNSARRFAPPTLQGKLGHVSDVFSLTEPHVLRYRSHGVIFVLYLRDGEGNVLQNLHLGGRGEAEYLIEWPGEYSLKIDGSAAWEIWLEPIKEALNKPIQDLSEHAR